MTYPATNYQTRFITSADGVRLSVREAGNPGGTAVIFIHGISQCQLAFSKQMESGLLKDFRLITYDLRGHGESDKPVDDVFYTEGRRWADDLKAVIDSLNSRPVVVGWSLGGRVISQYLDLYGDAALGGIHFVAAPAISRRGVSSLGAAGKLLLDMRSPLLETNIASTSGFVRACFNRPLTLDEFTNVLAYNMITTPQVRRATLAWPGELTEAVENITVPTLISHGAQDQVIAPATSEYIASKVKHSRLSWYEGAGHTLFWENAERFNTELAAFVNAVSAP